MEQTIISIPLEPAPIRHPKLGDIKATPKPRYLSHWAIISHDADASDIFYRTLTGAVLTNRPTPFAVATSFDHEHHRFFFGHRQGLLALIKKPELAQVPVPATGSRIGAVGGAIRYRSPKALAKAVERMRTIGREPEKIVDRGAVVSAFYHDPDNLLVEVFASVAGVAAKQEQQLDPQVFAQRFG